MSSTNEENLQNFITTQLKLESQVFNSRYCLKACHHKINQEKF